MDPYPHEERWNTVGSAGGIAIFFVVHTAAENGEDGRIDYQSEDGVTP